MATSKTWTQTLDPDPEKPGPWKTWTLKNLDYEKRGKQLDVKKKIRINIEILLRKDLQASQKSMMEVFHESI